MQAHDSIDFVKMHGLGNDFIIVDCRDNPFDPGVEAIRLMADRYRGIGCDQLVLIRPPRDGRADIFMDLYNADGSMLEACGNATRCVAAWMGRPSLVIQTVAGLLQCTLHDDAKTVTVDMGPARFEWRDIPLAQETVWNACTVPGIEWERPLPAGYALSVGNPHIVFPVSDVMAVPLEKLGPQIENHPLFPNRINVEFVQVTGPDSARMRVWERGVGVTQACGSGACATGIALVENGLVQGRSVRIEMDGGGLDIRWEDGRVHMTGETAFVFNGRYPLALIAGQKKAA